MLTRQAFRILMVILCFVISSTASARAGSIHTSAGVDGTWTGAENFGNYWQRGDLFASAKAGAGLASGFASVNLIGPDPGFHFLLRAGSDSSENASFVYTKAQWIDVIRVSSTTPPPDQLQVHVSVEGVVDLSRGRGLDASTIFGVEADGGNSLIGSSPGLQTQGFNLQSNVSIAVDPPPFAFFLSSNTQNLSHNPFVPSEITYSSRISWDTTFNLPYPTGS